jgi:hypothetical protein
MILGQKFMYDNFILNVIKILPKQHYVIKFISNLWQIGGLLQVLWFPPQ